MKRPLTSREKLISLICCFMIAVFVLYHFAWRFVKGNIDGLDAQIDGRLAGLKKARQLLAEASGYQQRYDEYLGRLGQNDSDEAVFSRLLSEIEQVSSQAGLKVSDMKPLRMREEKFYRMFPVSVAVDGELVATLEFIDLLQDHSHRFDVIDMRMDQAQRKGAEIKTRLVLGKVFIKE